MDALRVAFTELKAALADFPDAGSEVGRDLKDAAQALLSFALEEAYYPLAYDGKFRELIQALQKATLNG